MPPSRAPVPAIDATGRARVRLPATAERLRLPLHARTQARLRERWGFDLNAPDAPSRAEELLAVSPADPERLLLAAAVRSSRGDDAGALRAARAAVETDPASGRAHTTLATLLARDGGLDDARAHAQRATELDPDDPVALYNRGVSAWAAHEHGAAHADFARAAALLGVGEPAPWWRRWWHPR